MDSWSRISSGVLVTAMICGGVGSAYGAAPQHSTHRLTVAVYDYAGIEPATLAYAKQIAGDVYLRAGIEIVWVDPDVFEDAGSLHINLLSREITATSSISRDTVGFATPGSFAANAIYDRIREVAHDYHLPCGVMLGYVMAHELGHLLLPAHSHSESGVMRANLDVQLAAEKKLGFTSDQSALILERLMVRPVVSTH